MHFALQLLNPLGLFDNKAREDVFVFRQWPAVRLREEAVEALQKSTTMLKQGLILLKQGRREAAHSLLNEARAKRNDSLWLMAKANELEKAYGSLVSSQYYQALSSTVHPH